MKYKKMNSNFLTIICALLAIAFAYFWNLGTPVMWGDEAETVNFSRIILQKGVPNGFDGRNLLAYENCSALSTSLLSKKIPWLQYYVGSISLLLFGQSTMGARFLFAFVGLLTFFPLYSIIKRHSSSPAFISTLVLISPQFVLFQRNARYYSLLTFLFVCLIWTYYHLVENKKLHVLIPILLSVCFFHTHQLAAFCVVGSLCVYSVIKKSKSFPVYAVAFFLGALSWIVLNIFLKSVREADYLIINLLFTQPAFWASVFLTGLKVSILDLDFLNSLPLIAWSVTGVLAINKEIRKCVLEAIENPLCHLLGINLLLQVVSTSALIGYETEYQYSNLRYFPNLVGLMIIPLFLTVEKIETKLRLFFLKESSVRKIHSPFSYTSGKKNIFSMGLSIFKKNQFEWTLPLILITIFSTNVFNVSYWLKPLPRRPTAISWWIPVYSEIATFPQPDPIKKTIEILEKEDYGNDKTIYIMPPYLNEVFINYVGNKYFVQPDVIKNSSCADVIIKRIGFLNFERLFNPPEWVIIFNDVLNEVPLGFTRERIPFNRASTDATRPELTRHGFIMKNGEGEGSISIYKYKQGQ